MKRCLILLLVLAFWTATATAAPTAVVEINADSWFTENEAHYEGVSMTEMYAPAAVFVEGWKSAPRDEIVEYRWDFDDESGYAYGFNQAHVYEEPGVYEIELQVTDADSLTDIDTIVVMVNESNTATYYVDSDIGDDENDGLSPADAWKTATKAFRGIDNGQDTYAPGTQILFNRGQTFDFDTGTIITYHSYNYGMAFGVYGEGAKPVIKNSLGSGVFIQNTGNGSWFISFTDLEIDGTTTDGDVAGEFFNTTQESGHIMFLRCDFHDIMRVVGANGGLGVTDKKHGYFLFDCTGEDFTGSSVQGLYHCFAMKNCSWYLTDTHAAYLGFLDRAIIEDSTFSHYEFGNHFRISAASSGFSVPTNNVLVQGCTFTGFKDLSSTNNINDETIKNGRFTYNDDFWYVDTGWARTAGGTMGHTAGNDNVLYQPIEDSRRAYSPGTSYAVTFTVSSTTAGSVIPWLGTTEGDPVSADGTYTVALTFGADPVYGIRLEPSDDFDGEIDFVSCVPASGRYNWNLVQVYPNTTGDQSIEWVEFNDCDFINGETLLNLSDVQDFNLHDCTFSTDANPAGNINAARIKIGEAGDRPLKRVNIHDNTIVSEESGRTTGSIFYVFDYDGVPYGTQGEHEDITVLDSDITMLTTTTFVWQYDSLNEALLGTMDTDRNTVDGVDEDITDLVSVIGDLNYTYPEWCSAYGLECGLEGPPEAVWPTEAQVLFNIIYGPNGDDYTGTRTDPDVGDVRDGIQWGAGGVEFTGTMDATGGDFSGEEKTRLLAGADAAATVTSTLVDAIAAALLAAHGSGSWATGPSVAAIDAQLTSTHGEGAWTGGGEGGGGDGPGSDQCTLTITSGGVPVGNAQIWITATTAIIPVVAGVKVTDDNGHVEFMLNDGASYYLWANCPPGTNDILAQPFTAEADE